MYTSFGPQTRLTLFFHFLCHVVGSLNKEIPPRFAAPLVYIFDNSTNGWVFSHNNGNQWNITATTDSVPGGYAQVLAVQNGIGYAGPTVAISPVLRPLDTDSNQRLDITFWLRASVQVPVQFKVYKEVQEYYRPKRTLLANLGALGTIPSQDYFKISVPVPVENDSTAFQIVLEGYTGQSKSNMIVVAEMEVTGCAEAETGQTNLTRWQTGSTYGSSWYTEVTMDQHGTHVNWGMSPLSEHPGLATLESPFIVPNWLHKQKLALEFWLQGSEAYPAELALRRRRDNGIYDSEPFLDLKPYGIVRNLGFQWIETTLPRSSEPFQIILEGCLGSTSNLVRVRNVTLTTLNSQDETLKAEHWL